MTPAAALDRLVATHAGGLLHAAEALASAVVAPDYPAGLAILEAAGHARDAFAIGSGHLVAEALGCRRRPAAVVVGAAARLRDQLVLHGVYGLRDAVAAATVDVELTGLHEAAHCLANPIDEPADESRLAACRELCSIPSPPCPISRRVASHGPAWAAGYAVLVARAVPFRRRVAEPLLNEVRTDFADHGLPFDLVAKLVADVPVNAPLRPLLADAGFVRTIRKAIPSDAERVATLTTDIDPAEGPPAVTLEREGTAA